MTANPQSLREALSAAIAEHAARSEPQPRARDGKFGPKNGSAAEIRLSEDYSGSFDPAVLSYGFKVPELTTLEPSSAQNPITDPRLTGSAKTRLARLVEEKSVTAIASSDSHDGTSVTMLCVGDDSIYTTGETPRTTEEALAAVVREAASGDEGATEFLRSAFSDEMDGLMEYVSEESR